MNEILWEDFCWHLFPVEEARRFRKAFQKEIVEVSLDAGALVKFRNAPATLYPIDVSATKQVFALFLRRFQIIISFESLPAFTASVIE